MEFYITFSQKAVLFYLNLNKISQVYLDEKLDELLGENTSLLDLSDKSIGERGAKDLAEILKVNKSLITLVNFNHKINQL